jgi:hypothetical protein
MAVIDDNEQQYLIAIRLGMEDDEKFRRYLALVWEEKAWLTRLPAGTELRRLQVTREGIQYILGRNRDKRDIRMGTIYRKDGEIPKTLILMLNAVQDDINTLVNRTQSRPAATGVLATGLLAPAAPGDPTRGTA